MEAKTFCDCIALSHLDVLQSVSQAYECSNDRLVLNIQVIGKFFICYESRQSVGSFPVNMALFASTGPVLACTGMVLASVALLSRIYYIISAQRLSIEHAMDNDG